ncbi:hypothetical protein N5V81_12780 [Escherichia coli]|nr:hypothetical protein [Escherichia coli]
MAFEEIDVQGVPYYEFRFDLGTVVFPNRMLQVLSASLQHRFRHLHLGNRPSGIPQ